MPSAHVNFVLGLSRSHLRAMADLELELSQFSFSLAIRSHYVYLVTHLRMRIATVNAATVRGRPLLRLARVLCGAFSRVAFIQGAAFIQGNTVYNHYTYLLHPNCVDQLLTMII